MKRVKLQMLGLSVNDLLTREQMKKVMGGSGSGGSGGDTCSGSCDYQWTDAQGHTHTTTGSCLLAQPGNLCYCSSGGGSCSGK
ncbi:MAG: hypothetical protein ACTHM7_20455 [Ginsengibacter sp.]